MFPVPNAILENTRQTPAARYGVDDRRCNGHARDCWDNARSESPRFGRVMGRIQRELFDPPRCATLQAAKTSRWGTVATSWRGKPDLAQDGTIDASWTVNGGSGADPRSG
jgi:hypothetical protein